MELSDHRYTKTAFCVLTVCGWESSLSHDLLSKFKFGVCDFDYTDESPSSHFH